MCAHVRVSLSMYVHSALPGARKAKKADGFQQALLWKFLFLSFSD